MLTGYSNYLRTLFSLILASMLLVSCSSSRKSRSTESEEPAGSIKKKYGALLEVSPKNINNAALYNYIDKWMDTAYNYGGQNKKGVDCSGFTQMLYDQVFKKKLPRTSEAQYKTIHAFTSKKQLEEGDLVFFTTIKGKKISHVGVYLQNNRFVNATNKGVDISDMNLKYWSDRFVAGGRL